MALEVIVLRKPRQSDKIKPDMIAKTVPAYWIPATWKIAPKTIGPNKSKKTDTEYLVDNKSLNTKKEQSKIIKEKLAFSSANKNKNDMSRSVNRNLFG